MKNSILILLLCPLLWIGCKNNQASQADAEVVNVASSDEVFLKVPISEYMSALQKAQNPLVIDVRTPGEVAEGMIPNAQHIDFYADDFKSRIAALNKESEVFVYCKSGGRSGQSASVLKSLGFKKVVDLEGGYSDYKDWIDSKDK